jgi:hypothetical protein
MRQSATYIDPRFIGGTSASQLAVSQIPRSFDYRGLEERYPTSQVRPLVPEYIKTQVDEIEIERKANELNNRLRESQLQRMNRQITLEDAELKKMIATDSEISTAQAEIGSLNPQSETYLQDRVKFSQKYPLAASSREYQSSVLGFLDQQHNEWRRQQEAMGQGGGGVGLREYQSAMGEISKYARLAQEGELAPGELDYLADMQAIVDQYRAQQSSRQASQTPTSTISAQPTPMPTPSPRPTPGFQPIQGTTGQKEPLNILFGR